MTGIKSLSGYNNNCNSIENCATHKLYALDNTWQPDDKVFAYRQSSDMMIVALNAGLRLDSDKKKEEKKKHLSHNFNKW